MPREDDLYALLGLQKDATPEEVRRAYHEAALRLHPDVNRQPGETELFLRVQEAYEILSELHGPQNEVAGPKAEAAQPSPAAAPISLIYSNVIYSRSALPLIGEPQLAYVLLELMPGKDVKPAPPPPLNISLVIDRSTSMQGALMDTVKASAIELLRQLRAEDRMAVITFSDRAEVILPAGRPPDRQTAESQIRMIKTGGSTVILKGLEAGLFELRRSLSRSQVNHLILLTDGRTYGDEDECLQLAEQAAALGVRITAMGIGSKWNDTFLDELSARTGGASLYISRPAAVREFLQEKLTSLNEVFAEQIQLDLALGPGVELNYAFRLHPDVSPLPLDSPLRLGSIPYTAGLSILLEFKVPPLPAGAQQVLLADGELSLNVIAYSGALPKLSLKLVRPVDMNANNEPPPQSILRSMQQVTLYRMQEKARQDVEAGNIQSAGRRLQHLATHLLAQGERDLAHTVLVEAEQIQKTHTLSGEGEKRIKYGTRALLLPAKTEEEVLR